MVNKDEYIKGGEGVAHSLNSPVRMCVLLTHLLLNVFDTGAFGRCRSAAAV